MARSCFVSRLAIVFLCAVLGACAGICLQALRITGKPQEFRSLAKIVVMAAHDNNDLYGIYMETLEASDGSRRALERVRALNPELQESAVRIQTARKPGSGIIHVLATGGDPRYTRTFLNALLDELTALRQSMRERDDSKPLQDYLRAVVNAEKDMENAFEALEKAQSKVESPMAKGEQERLVKRLLNLRTQRDDLRLELKTAGEPARAGLETKLAALEPEIQSIEKAAARSEEAAVEFRIAADKLAQSKGTYERVFAQADAYRVSITERGNEAAIQERASTAVEFVEDWRMPIAAGALGGGLLGALVGWLLSLLILRSGSSPAPLTTA